MRSNPELPGTVPQPYEPLYRPHGVFEHTCGQRIVSENEGMPLKEGCAPENAVLLKKGTLGGKDITYVEKNYPPGSASFSRELYMYSSEELLRPLQGQGVPNVIAAFCHPDGHTSLVMEAVHSRGWYELHPSMVSSTRTDVRNAYKRLHARGILHGRVRRQNILVGDDLEVYLVNFAHAATVKDFSVHGIPTCNQQDLEEEMKQVENLFSRSVDTNSMLPWIRVEVGERSSRSSKDSPMPPACKSSRSLSRDSANASVRVSRHMQLAEADTSVNHINTTRHTAHATSVTPPDITAQKAFTPPIRDTPTRVQANNLTPATMSGPVTKPQPSQAHAASSSASKPLKKVAFHPDTKDNWIWSTGRDTHFKPSKRALLNLLSPQPANSSHNHSPSVSSSSSLLPPPSVSSSSSLLPPPSPHSSQSSDADQFAYREPPPRTADDSFDAEGDTPTFTILITGPTGEKRVWGVSQEFQTEIVKMLECRSAPGSRAVSPLPAGSPAPAKRKASGPHEEEPDRKRRTPVRESAPVNRDDSHREIKSPPRVVEVSPPLKRKAEESPEFERASPAKRILSMVALHALAAGSG